MNSLLLILGTVLLQVQSSSVVEEMMELNRKYAVRKSNMHIVMNMAVKDDCDNGQPAFQKVEYYYLDGNIYGKTNVWEMLYVNETYVFADHTNNVIMVSPTAADALKMKEKLSSFENIQNLLDMEAESSITTDVGGNKHIKILPAYGDYREIKVKINNNYQIETLFMLGRTVEDGGHFTVKKPYCINLSFDREEYGTVSKSLFKTSKFVTKTGTGYQLAPQFKHYKLVA